MAKAGLCAQCGANVWLTEEGACPNGHDASQISGVYEAEQQTDELGRVAGEVGESLTEAGHEAVKLGKRGLDWLGHQFESKPAEGESPGGGED